MTNLVIHMSRPDPSKNWGFRLQGGRDYNSPLLIASVNRDGLADRHGIQPGDQIVGIGGDPTSGMSHQQAQQTVIRCCNDIRLDITRGGQHMSYPATRPVAHNPAPAPPPAMMSHYANNAPNSPAGKFRTQTTITVIANQKSKSMSYDPNDYPAYNPPAQLSYAPGPSGGFGGRPEPQQIMPNYSAPVQSSAPWNAPMSQPKPYAAAPNYNSPPQSKPWAQQPLQNKPGPQYHSKPMVPVPSKQQQQLPFIERLNQALKSPGRPLPKGYQTRDKPAAVPAPSNRSASGPRRVKLGEARRQTAQPGGVPMCAVCNSAIRGPFMAALDMCYCPDHFRCARCSRDLEHCGFVEEAGQLYCEDDYAQYLAPVCTKCSQPVVEEVVTAMDAKWHTHCFLCTHCRRPIGNDIFHVGDDNLPYCEEDYTELFEAKCDKCGFPIDPLDRVVEALNKTFHSKCFACSACQAGLDGKPFVQRDGKPFCKAHAKAAAIF